MCFVCLSVWSKLKSHKNSKTDFISWKMGFSTLSSLNCHFFFKKFDIWDERKFKLNLSLKYFSMRRMEASRMENRKSFFSYQFSTGMSNLNCLPRGPQNELQMHNDSKTNWYYFILQISVCLLQWFSTRVPRYAGFHELLIWVPQIITFINLWICFISCRVTRIDSFSEE